VDLLEIRSKCQSNPDWERAWRLRMSLGRDAALVHFILQDSSIDFVKAQMELECFNTTKPRKTIIAACNKRLQELR
jgi:hypothetical protein